MLFSCIKNEEPAGITAMREAKAALITAEAQYKLAEVAYLEAETAYQLLLNEAQAIQNELDALALALKQAKNEKQIAKIQQDMELAAEKHKKAMFEALEATAKAEDAYNTALENLAKAAEKALTDAEKKAVQEAVDMISKMKKMLDIAKGAYAEALDTYFDVAYLDEWDYETYAAKYAKKINELTADVEAQTMLAEALKGVDVNAGVAAYQAKVEEYEAEVKANEKKMVAIVDQAAALEEEKLPLYNSYEEVTNKINDLDDQIGALAWENDALKDYTNSDVFFSLELTVAKETAHDYAALLMATSEDYNAEWYGIESTEVEVVVEPEEDEAGDDAAAQAEGDEAEAGDDATEGDDAEAEEEVQTKIETVYSVPSGVVKFRFEGCEDVEGFLEALALAFEEKDAADLKKAYATEVAAKAKAVADAKAANDKKVKENEDKIYSLENEIIALERQQDEWFEKWAPIQSKLDELEADYFTLDTINGNIGIIIRIYESLIDGTAIELPKLEGDQIVMEVIYCVDSNIDLKAIDDDKPSITREELAKLIEKAVKDIEAYVAIVENEIATREAAYEELLASEDIAAALQLEADYAKLELDLAKQMYDYYLAEFEYWTGILNGLTTKTE